MSRIKTGICIAAVASIVLAGWAGYRANFYGINNVFSREYQFSEPRPLTAEVAIDVTRRCLEAAGYDTSVLVPFENDHYEERVFARNTINENDGKVYWGPSLDMWLYHVSVQKQGDTVRCRVVKTK